VQPDVAGYLRELVSRVQLTLGDELVGVYAGGSLALGDYRPGRSDIDVAVVARSPLASEVKRAIADALRHDTLPCPARGLELVVYSQGAARLGTGEAGYELNLNTGRGVPFVLSFEPEGETHWYAVDRAVLRAHGVALAGPPPAHVFPRIPRNLLVERVTESVRWYAQHPWAGADNAVLNACRAWRWAAEGVWSSKTAAGTWAIGRAEDGAIVEEAVGARAEARVLDEGRVRLFVESVLRVLEGEGARAPGSPRS
jgi:hypothetical protein